MNFERQSEMAIKLTADVPEGMLVAKRRGAYIAAREVKMVGVKVAEAIDNDLQKLVTPDDHRSGLFHIPPGISLVFPCANPAGSFVHGPAKIYELHPPGSDGAK